MTRRILFVDDEQRVLEALYRMLRVQRHVWDMVCCNDPRQAWEQLQETTFDVVVSDINMPGMSGLELLERIRGSASLKDIPVIMLTGLDSRGMKRQALDMGAADLLNKPVEAEDLIARLSSVFRLKDYHDELKSQNALLEQRVQERTADLNRSRLEAIWRLAKAAEHRDDNSGDHVVRVACTSRIIAEELGLARPFVETLFVAAPLHDIGKIGIPDAILLKRDPLEPGEWAIIQQHTTIGAQILLDDTAAARMFAEWSTPNGTQAPRQATNPLLATAARVALSHHERWDGAGYPSHLVGEQIPLEARIVAVADVFDALTSPRPYKPALSEAAALEIMRRSAKGHFDPNVYAAFLRVLPDIQHVRTRCTDERRSLPTCEEAADVASAVC
jgi:response regulator RpfG family c-di-GMP phosphodiesterase